MNNVDQEAAAGVPPSDPRVIVISQPATRELPSGSKTFEHIVNLVKALVWPLLIAIFFLVYRDTAGQIADQLPGLMAHVTKVSGGGLAVEIQQQAQQAGGMQLSNVVTSLDGGDIQQILKIGCGYWGLIGTGGKPDVYSAPNGPQRDTLLKLESRGILRFTLKGESIKLTDIEKQLAKFPKVTEGPTSSAADFRFFLVAKDIPEDQKQVLRADYVLTDLGRDTFNSVLAAVTAQLPGNKAKQPVGCSSKGVGQP
jgi:hypothetical protein